jgi:type I restriction enzyme S subunit
MLAPSAKRHLYKLGDVAATASGTTPSRSQKRYWEPGTIPWVKTSEIAFGRISSTEEAVSEVALRECSLPLLPVGTVLIAMYGQGKTRGHSAILEIEATTNQACFAILPNKAFSPEYLQYWLQFSYQSLRDISDGRGGNQANLNGDMLRNLQVPWVERQEQEAIVDSIKRKLSEVEAARAAALNQLREVGTLTDAIVFNSVSAATSPTRLGEVLDEVKHGIGVDWASHPVLGATRDGLAPAKEPPGKQAPKYKPATPGTVFYNPMRILIGSIAYVDEDDDPGITSPDYVVLRGKPGIVDSRWFYYWLRSPLGAHCILSLARGAVRERMLFNRLAEGEIALPSYAEQQRASAALKELKPLKRALESRLSEINRLPQKILAAAFEM